MTDEELRDALRSLPRHRASEGFTDRVLDHLEQTRRSRKPDGLWQRLRSVVGPAGGTFRWTAVAAAALLAALLPTAVRHHRPPTDADSRQAVQELRSELEELKRLAADTQTDEPVLYLGGDDRVELVVDLADPMGPWAPASLGGRRASPGARPTAEGW